MSDISAQLVKELRDKSGAGFMECKRALVESNGDLEAAQKELRKRGVAVAAKKAGREAKEGVIGSANHVGKREILAHLPQQSKAATSIEQDDGIRDGQTAAILIASDGVQAHRLPQSALTLNNDGQLGVRTVDSDNIVQFHAIELVRDDIDGIWVSGLDEQTDVIVMGQDFVIAGVEVAPTYREASK